MSPEELRLRQARKEALVELIETSEVLQTVPPQALIGLTFQTANSQGELIHHVLYKTPEFTSEEHEDPTEAF